MNRKLISNPSNNLHDFDLDFCHRLAELVSFFSWENLLCDLSIIWLTFQSHELGFIHDLTDFLVWHPLQSDRVLILFVQLIQHWVKRICWFCWPCLNQDLHVVAYAKNHVFNTIYETFSYSQGHSLLLSKQMWAQCVRHRSKVVIYALCDQSFCCARNRNIFPQLLIQISKVDLNSLCGSRIVILLLPCSLKSHCFRHFCCQSFTICLI